MRGIVKWEERKREGERDATFADMRAVVVRVDGADEPLAGFVGVDVRGVEVFADVV